MSKYKVGDKVLVEGEVVEIDNSQRMNTRIMFKDESEEWFSDEYLNTAKTYEDGLNDAWELARKICGDSENKNNYTGQELNNIFGHSYDGTIINDFTYQQALAKIETYEKSQQIQVGDVVYADDEPDLFGVVTWINEKLVYVMWDDGYCGCKIRIEELHKTGRTVDIKHLLEQIRGNE